MKLPRYWAKEEAEALTPAGKPVRVAAWRWSDSSLDEARRNARQVIGNILQRVQAGQPFPARYAYGSRPVREEVLREILDGSGQTAAAITRNVYGALVLNTAGAMFVDSDSHSDADGTAGGGLLGRLFGRQPKEDPAVSRARALVDLDPEANVRVYRTKAGVRYLLTHALFDPASERARDVMGRLSADPKYVQLCKVQESFRARLTP